MKNSLSISFFILLLSGLLFFTCKKDSAPTQKYPTRIKTFEANQAAELAKKIRAEVSVELANDLELSLWASDSLVNDPIAISIDPQGKIYYTSGSRQANSEFDIRGHLDWMTASISFQTVEDRRAFLRKTFESENESSKKFLKDLNEDGVRDWKDLAVQKEQVWVVSDESGRGVADRAQLYLEDFNEEITDVANGLAYHDGEVYISVGPDMWRTKDEDGDGIADVTTSLSHGYVVHIGFSGHGMSGVTMGPDGRIWWGLGDIGMNVVDQTGKHWKNPNRGTIMRCEPDGSNFEVYAMGVRNTHEFVFDKYGNLISVDNDGDHSGERERLVYLINGSDTGWRFNWQFGKYTDPDNNTYKVWMDEKLDIPHWDGQAAYILPPIANYVNGPTGMVYNPGTALGPEWYEHFFVAEFRGSPSNSPIHAFTLKPDGCSFALDSTQEVVKGLLPTGLDFGPDGALYFGDWINGWGTKKEGRIWKLDSSDQSNAELRKSTQKLLQTDFANLKLNELSTQLGHQDMRVRTKAQFELVKRGDDGLKDLRGIANNSANQLARIHAIWGIGQLARKEVETAKYLVPLFDDEDPEVVAQAIKTVGDVRYVGANQKLISLLTNQHPRVQFFATEALGRIGDANAVLPILNQVKINNDEDIWLRAAAMIALGRIGQVAPLVALTASEFLPLRTAAVVALRRMEHPDIAKFLNDSDEYIVTEAARGINDDFSIPAALPDLARVLKVERFQSEALLRRAINANLRVGKLENIELLRDFALRKSAPPAMRAEAIATLSSWGKPSVFDRVDGRYRGVITRDDEPVKTAFQPIVKVLLEEKDEEILVATIDAVQRLSLRSNSSDVFAIFKKSPSGKVRQVALTALHQLEAKEIEPALEMALADKNNLVRSKALEILPESKIAEAKAVQLFDKIIKTGSVQEQQAALAAISKYKSAAAVEVLNGLFQKLKLGKLTPDIRLDLMEAIENQSVESLTTQLSAYQIAKPKDDVLAEFRETLSGGNGELGKQIFNEHTAGQCTRCHAIFEYGGNAGPGLDGVGERLSKEEILTALVAPSEAYALGYEVAALELKDGSSVAGVVLEKTSEFIKIKIGKEDLRTVQNSEISKRQSLPSSMPAMGSILSKREIRDLVAFLSGL